MRHVDLNCPLTVATVESNEFDRLFYARRIFSTRRGVCKHTGSMPSHLYAVCTVFCIVRISLAALRPVRTPFGFGSALIDISTIHLLGK